MEHLGLALHGDRDIVDDVSAPLGRQSGIVKRSRLFDDPVADFADVRNDGIRFRAAPDSEPFSEAKVILPSISRTRSM